MAMIGGGYKSASPRLSFRGASKTRTRNLDMGVSDDPSHSKIPGSRCRAPRNDDVT